MLPESELIMNPDGSIYHLHLLPDHISDTILTVGDPARVAQVSRHFDSIEFEGANREFVTHVGYYRGKRLTVISTGIGTDNVDIVLNELDALVNIDFMARTVRPPDERLSLRIIRLGTSGQLASRRAGGHAAGQPVRRGPRLADAVLPAGRNRARNPAGHLLAAKPGPALRALRGARRGPAARGVGGGPARGQHRHLPRLLRSAGPAPAP